MQTSCNTNFYFLQNCFVPLLHLFFSLCASLVLLSLFCLGYNYTGCHVTNPNGATDYKWEARQYFSTMKEGFSWFRFDANGYNNLDDSSFSGRPVDVLLMGSSHMGAAQIPKDKNTGSLLNEMLPRMRTYNIGISGHTLLHCVSNLKAAVQVFDPQNIVIIETGSVSPDEKAMSQVLDGSFPKIPSNDRGLIYIVQKTVPAIKSLYKSVTEWKDASAIRKGKKSDAVPIHATEEYRLLLAEFLQKAKDSLGGRRRLIIFYHPAARLDDDGSFNENNSGEFLEAFADACKSCGIEFVDMTDDFSDLYFRRRKFAHGFSNTAISTGHLNKYGHRVIAERLVKTISMGETKI